MGRSKRTILIIAVSLLIVIAARLTFAFVNYAKVERRFPSIHPGSTRDSVVARFGKPNYYQGKCGVIHIPEKTCSLEYVYSNPFAPLIPEYHIVSFSKDGHVIEADDWNSP